MPTLKTRNHFPEMALGHSRPRHYRRTCKTGGQLGTRHGPSTVRLGDGLLGRHLAALRRATLSSASPHPTEASPASPHPTTSIPGVPTPHPCIPSPHPLISLPHPHIPTSPRCIPGIRASHPGIHCIPPPHSPNPRRSRTSPPGRPLLTATPPHTRAGRLGARAHPGPQPRTPTDMADLSPRSPLDPLGPRPVSPAPPGGQQLRPTPSEGRGPFRRR